MVFLDTFTDFRSIQRIVYVHYFNSIQKRHPETYIQSVRVEQRQISHNFITAFSRDRLGNGFCIGINIVMRQQYPLGITGGPAGKQQNSQCIMVIVGERRKHVDQFTEWQKTNARR